MQPAIKSLPKIVTLYNVTIEAIYPTLDTSNTKYGTGVKSLVYCLDEDKIYTLYNTPPTMQYGLHLFFSKIVCSEIMMKSLTDLPIINSNNDSILVVIAAEIYDILPTPNSFPRLYDDNVLISKLWKLKDKSALNELWTKRVCKQFVCVIINKIQWRASVLSYLLRFNKAEEICNNPDKFKEALEKINFSFDRVTKISNTTKVTELQIDDKYIDQILGYRKDISNKPSKKRKRVTLEKFLESYEDDDDMDIDNPSGTQETPENKICRLVACMPSVLLQCTISFNTISKYIKSCFENMKFNDVVKPTTGANEKLGLIETMQKCIENVKLRCALWYQITNRFNNFTIPSCYANKCYLFVHDSYDIINIFWPRLAPIMGSLEPMLSYRIWKLVPDLILPICTYLASWISNNKKLSISGLKNMMESIPILKNAPFHFKNAIKCWSYIIYVLNVVMKSMDDHKPSSIRILQSPNHNDNTISNELTESSNLQNNVASEWQELIRELMYAYTLYCIDLKNESSNITQNNITIVNVPQSKSNNSIISIDLTTPISDKQININNSINEIREISKLIVDSVGVVNLLGSISKIQSALTCQILLSQWQTFYNMISSLSLFHPTNLDDINRENKRLQLYYIKNINVYKNVECCKGPLYSLPSITRCDWLGNTALLSNNSNPIVGHNVDTSILLKIMETSPQIYQIITTSDIQVINNNSSANNPALLYNKWQRLVLTATLSPDEHAYVILPAKSMWLSHYKITNQWQSIGRFWLQRNGSTSCNKEAGFIRPLFNYNDLDYLISTEGINSKYTLINYIYMDVVDKLSGLYTQHIKSKDFDGSLIIIVLPVLLETIISSYENTNNEIKEGMDILHDYRIKWDRLAKANHVKICTGGYLSNDLDQLDSTNFNSIGIRQFNNTIVAGSYHIWMPHFEMFSASELYIITRALQHQQTLSQQPQIRSSIKSIQFHHIPIWGHRRFCTYEATSVTLCSYMYQKYKSYTNKSPTSISSESSNTISSTSASKFMEAINLLKSLSPANSTDTVANTEPSNCTNNISMVNIPNKILSFKSKIIGELRCLYALMRKHVIRIDDITIANNSMESDNIDQLYHKNKPIVNHNLDVYISWVWHGSYSYNKKVIQILSANCISIVYDVFHLIANTLFDKYVTIKDINTMAASSSFSTTSLDHQMIKKYLAFATDHSIPLPTKYDNTNAYEITHDNIKKPPFHCYFKLFEIFNSPSSNNGDMPSSVYTKWIHPSKLWHILIHWPRHLQNIVIINANMNGTNNHNKVATNNDNSTMDVIDRYFEYWSKQYNVNTGTAILNSGVELFL